MYKKYRKKQAGKGFPLLAAALPLAKIALPFLGKAALGGAASFGATKVLGKILGDGKKPHVKSNRLYLDGKIPYVQDKRLYLGGKKRKKQTGGFFPSIGIWAAKKLIGLGKNKKTAQAHLLKWLAETTLYY